VIAWAHGYESGATPCHPWRVAQSRPAELLHLAMDRRPVG